MQSLAVSAVAGGGLGGHVQGPLRLWRSQTLGPPNAEAGPPTWALSLAITAEALVDNSSSPHYPLFPCK